MSRRHAPRWSAACAGSSGCRAEFERIGETDAGLPRQALFPIVQGGTHAALRAASVRGIRDAGDWIGVAIGGLSVGEAKADMHATLETCEPLLPQDTPRYLMGVGHPDDLVEGVRRGVDLFDCVAPTRMGRHGTAFTPDGSVQVTHGSFREDRRPLVDGCSCPCCAEYDRAYLRHLFVAKEDLGKRLLALHNVTFLLELMRTARERIEDGSFAGWSEEWLARYAARGVIAAS
jgi:queuine tRNA-ribosyltransferase